MIGRTSAVRTPCGQPLGRRDQSMPNCVSLGRPLGGRPGGSPRTSMGWDMTHRGRHRSYQGRPRTPRGRPNCPADVHGTVAALWTQHYNTDNCCVHNASTVPWTSAGQFGRLRGVRGRPWYDLWRPRCVISHPMDVRGLPPGRPPSGRPRDTQFGIDWSLLPSGCPQGVRTAEVQPITARTHYGQEVGLPTVRPKPEVDVP